MMLAPPLRFLHCYIVRRGFLDGMAGLQVSMLTGISSFVKQARMWEWSSACRSPIPKRRLPAPKTPTDARPEPLCAGES